MLKRLEGNVLVEETEPNGKKVTKAKRRNGQEYKPGKGRVYLFRLPDDSDWLPAEEWPAHDVAMVCRTPGCPMEGEAVPGQVGENVDGVYRAACGACGQAITELWVEEGVTPLPLDPPDPPKIAIGNR